MAAYWLARSKINDPVEYKKYTDQVPGIIAQYGGKVLACLLYTSPSPRD